MSDKPNLILDQNFYQTHTELFTELMASVRWDDRMNARKTASFGKPYVYSQVSYAETEIPSCLNDVISCLHARLDVTFNNCLLNFYETGKNTMGFHSDETSGLLAGTGVAIISLGSERTITFRSKTQTIAVDYRLKPGSMLYMDEEVQDNWMHAIRKENIAGPRISLTWRAIGEQSEMA